MIDRVKQFFRNDAVLQNFSFENIFFNINDVDDLKLSIRKELLEEKGLFNKLEFLRDDPNIDYPSLYDTLATTIERALFIPMYYNAKGETSLSDILYTMTRHLESVKLVLAKAIDKTYDSTHLKTDRYFNYKNEDLFLQKACEIMTLQLTCCNDLYLLFRLNKVPKSNENHFYFYDIYKKLSVNSLSLTDIKLFDLQLKSHTTLEICSLLINNHELIVADYNSLRYDKSYGVIYEKIAKQINAIYDEMSAPIFAEVKELNQNFLQLEGNLKIYRTSKKNKKKDKEKLQSISDQLEHKISFYLYNKSKEKITGSIDIQVPL